MIRSNETNNISQKINSMFASLKWDIRLRRHAGQCEIMSFPEKKLHRITLPNPDHRDQLRPIEYLHELYHAKLCETVHPLFSGSIFTQNSNPEYIQFYTPLFRCVNDWFVDGLLITLCPEEELDEIKEHTEMILDNFEKFNSGNLAEFCNLNVCRISVLFT